MNVPAWLLDSFAAIMLAVAAISAARLALAWRAGRRSDPDADIDASHLLMGIAMAGTLTASLSTLPSRAWEIIFAALTVWFAYRVTREYRAGRGVRALVSEHHAPHLLHSAAMLYMFLALRPAPSHGGSSMAGMAGMSGAGAQTLRLPTLAFLFALLLCAYVVADLDRVPAPHRFRAALAPSPALAAAGAGPGAPAPAGALASSGSLAASASSVLASAPGPVSASDPEASMGKPVPAPSGLLSPGIARGCRIAMGVTMAFMLIIMI